jgi:ubiquinone/menaquinone biosynthesis C-methylase UbiE
MIRPSPADKIDRNHYSYTAYESDTVTHRFDAARFSGDFGRFIAEHQETFLIRQIGSPAGRRILDLGAGTGRLSIPLSRLGGHVVAADASQKMHELLHRKTCLQGIRLHQARTDAHALPFADRSFDVVLSFRMIMHVVDWRHALTEICRVSRDYVILDFPPISGLAGLAPLIHPVIRLVKKHHQSYRVFRVRDVVSAFRSEGFDVTAMDKHLVLPFGLHRCVNSASFTHKMEAVLQKAGFRDLFGAPVTLVARRKNGQP